MKVFITAAALMLTIGAAPVFATDRESSECYSGRFREPLCQPTVRHHGKTVVIDEREPDVIILPHSPYVIVNWPRR